MDSKKQILSKIQQRIEYHRKDTLWHHFLTFLKMENSFEGFSGYVREDNFAIWRYSHWYGAFYIVVRGEVKETDNRVNVLLRCRTNLFGRLMAFLILAGWGYSIVVGIVLQQNNEWEFLWKRIIVGCIMFAIPVFLMWLLTRGFKRDAYNEVRSLILKNSPTTELRE
jgi:hypothetical protein